MGQEVVNQMGNGDQSIGEGLERRTYILPQRHVETNYYKFTHINKIIKMDYPTKEQQ